MPKQTFRLRKNLILNILLSFSSVTLTLFGFLIVSPLISESTHAEGDEPDDGITITVNGEVDANLVLFDEGDYKIAKDTVSVSSSAAYGYELFLTTDSEAHQSIYLNDDPTSESRIAPVSGTIAEPAVLTNNTWGFAIAGQGNFDNEYDPSNPDPASRFAIIPTTADQQAVYENSAATAEDNIDFYYGIKVEPTLEVGEYTTSAAYTAIAKEKPFIAKAILGDNGNLNFVYDRNDYAAGDTYTDNIGETTITNVYEVPINSSNSGSASMGWTDNNNIVSANFDSTFFNFKPVSTAYWFINDRSLASITNSSNLDTSQVRDMKFMFQNAGYNATTFGLDLSGWDTSNVSDMWYMFRYAGDNATTWSLNISGWDTGNVKRMSGAFASTGYNAAVWNIGGIGSLNTGNVTDMSEVFDYAGYKATAFNLDLSGWNTINVKNMGSMFRGAGYKAGAFNLNLSGWNTGNVTTMSSMFHYAGRDNATTFNVNLDRWTTDKVTNMRFMFEQAGMNATTWNISNIGDWNTGRVTDMSNMFSYAGSSANAFNMDLSKWNTGNVTTMSNMFSGSGKSAATWSVGDLSGWNTGKVTNMAGMFKDAGRVATVWDIGNLNYVDEEHKGWDVSKVTLHTNFVSWGQSNIDTSKLPWQSN